MSETLSRRLKRLWWRMRRHRLMARDLPAAGRRARVYARLMRFDRPIGNFLLLWPMLWGLWLAADGHPNPRVFVVFVLGVLIMRACGCVINDFADRRVDPHVKRTTQRPMATGEVTSGESLTIFVLLGLTAFVLVLFTNALTLKLAVAGIALAAVYPFMKRYTYLPQAWLGIAFGWAVPMAYAAQLGTVPADAWLVYIAVILWTVIFDTQYAMVDRDDDIRIGVKSTAILFGDQDRLILGLLQVTLMINLLLIGVQYQLNPGYYWALAFAALFFVYQQKLTWHRRREDCFRAFLNNNWFGGVVFAGIVLHYAFEPYLS